MMITRLGACIAGAIALCACQSHPRIRGDAFLMTPPSSSSFEHMISFPPVAPGSGKHRFVFKGMPDGAFGLYLRAYTAEAAQFMQEGSAWIEMALFYDEGNQALMTIAQRAGNWRAVSLEPGQSGTMLTAQGGTERWALKAERGRVMALEINIMYDGPPLSAPVTLVPQIGILEKRYHIF